jgi:hypothetical protein
VLLAALHMPAQKITPNKSDFIRKQPSSLSAAEVVAKGKAAGIKFSTQLVYNVRNGSKGKKGAAKKTSTPKPTVAASTKATVSKAAFVRAHASLSPKEIVKKAKAEGVKLDVRYVYNVRGYDKTKGKKKAAKARAPATKATAPTARPTRAASRTAPSVPRPITSTRSAEDLLRAVAAEIGLGRAIEQLQGERARVRAILRG